MLSNLEYDGEILTSAVIFIGKAPKPSTCVDIEVETTVDNSTPISDNESHEEETETATNHK